MQKAAALVVPGNLDSRTGGYIYDRHIVDGLRAMGWSVDVQSLDETFPRPTASAIAQAEEVFARLPAGTVTVVDSLVVGAIPGILEQHRSRLRIVALMHLPLAAAIGIEEEAAAQFAIAERRALEAAALGRLVPDADLARLTARMHVSRGGQMAAYGDDLDQSSETKSGLEQSVRERAYALWEQDGRPDGQAEEYWHRALDQHLRGRAYALWEQDGRPEGGADQYWRRVVGFESQ